MKNGRTFQQWMIANPPVGKPVFDSEKLRTAMIDHFKKNPKESGPATRIEVRQLAVKLGFDDHQGGLVWSAYRRNSDAAHP